jgi:3-oxoacyl-[acyl-carrier protein] reductase
LATPERAVALVTGGSSGIGAHVAARLAQAGFDVVACSRREPEQPVAGVEHAIADVTDEAAVRRLVRDIRKTRRRLDVAVNCAGIASMNVALLTPTATADRILQTNVTGTFTVCREAARVMAERKQGRIVNVGSVAERLELEGEAVYAASKSAVVTLTRILARELAPLGITCNVVAPGPVDTALLRGVPEEVRRRLLDRMTLGRLTTLDEVARTVEFFASPESGYLTGQVLYLGGC